MTAADPFVDIRALPPEVLRPIQPWVDDYLTAPQSERRVSILGIEFTIRRGPRGPMVRRSELLGVFAEFAKLAMASAETLRRQTAELEAESGLAVAKGHADNLKALIHAAQAQAKAERQLHEGQAQIAALTTERGALHEEIARLHELDKRHRTIGAQQVADIKRLLAEKKAADECANNLAQQRDALVSQVQQLTADMKMIEEDRDRLHRWLTGADKITAHFKDENARLKARVEGHTGVQSKCEQLARQNDLLAKRIIELVADKKVLEDSVWWLEERVRGGAPRAA